jgi:hypothetical protein
MRRFAFAAVLLAVLTGCQSGLEPEPIPSATGIWAGIGSQGFVFFDLTLALSEDHVGRLTGTGRLAPVAQGAGLQAYDFVIRTGAHGHPDILVSLMTPNRIDVNYSGRFVEADRIEGFMNGSGFNNLPVTMTRQTP